MLLILLVKFDQGSCFYCWFYLIIYFFFFMNRYLLAYLFVGGVKGMQFRMYVNRELDANLSLHLYSFTFCHNSLALLTRYYSIEEFCKYF